MMLTYKFVCYAVVLSQIMVTALIRYHHMEDVVLIATAKSSKQDLTQIGVRDDSPVTLVV